MKNFFRSVAGKTMLFFAITLAVIVLVIGAASAVLAAADGLYGFDTRAAVYEFRAGRVSQNARSYLFSVLDDYRWELPDFYECSVVGADGETVATTAGFAAASADPAYDSYTFFFTQEDRQGIWYNAGLQEYTVSVCVDSARFHDRPEELAASLLGSAEAARLPLIAAGAAALLVCVILFIVMMCVAGHRPKTDEIFPGTFARIPFDLLLAAVVLLFAFLLVVIYDTCDDEVLCAIAFFAWAFAAFESFLGLSMAFATRVKLRTLIRTSLCYTVLWGFWKLLRLVFRGLCFAGRGIRRGFSAIPLIPKTLLVIGLLSLAELMPLLLAWEEPGIVLLFFLLEKAVTLPLICWCALNMKRLQKLGEELAGGDLAATVNTERMLPEFRRHAENLSSIREGMALSVDRRMKSERMKTELITNVSHDIKTPLTSIINYSDLIAREPTENDKIREYSEVLTRQSAKLKRLIEDLVEASKAATGNLECDPVPCSPAVFLTQAAGEFADRLEAASLELVTSLPDEELCILADSRRMWRVFDNLMNNVCKYSQAGTRVYLSLARMGERAVITFRNTSRDALNISPDELMERFVRGDDSRSTEGNGLGLSIAKSLTELQGGTFTISIDGDLFKVLLSFPTIAGS